MDSDFDVNEMEAGLTRLLNEIENITVDDEEELNDLNKLIDSIKQSTEMDEKQIKFYIICVYMFDIFDMRVELVSIIIH